MLTQDANDTLVSVRIFAEDVANDDRCFLDDVRHPCRNKVEQCVDARLCRGLNLDGKLADSSDGFPYEMYVNLCGVLTKLREYLLNVIFICEEEDELEFCDFDVDGVVVPAFDCELLS